MSAKEMFKKLGYENDIKKEHTIGYIKNKKTITFNNSGNYIYFVVMEEGRVNPTIDLEELQAINEQVRELCWYE